jgi:hypothetical protein
MRWVIVAFILLLVVPHVYAVDEVLPGLAEGNKFLAAEVSREIRDAQENIKTDMKAYQDENFQIFDSRMTQFMSDAKMKMALGAIGAALISGALMALFLFRITRNYSYEKYLEGRLVQFKENNDARDISKGLAKMQQATWNDHVPNPTMGMVYGQAEAANMTQMNQWQSQPTYAGGWQSNVQVQPEYNRTPGGYYADPAVQGQQFAAQLNEQKPQFYPHDKNDPLDSPGWNPGGYS